MKEDGALDMDRTASLVWTEEGIRVTTPIYWNGEPKWRVVVIHSIEELPADWCDRV